MVGDDTVAETVSACPELEHDTANRAPAAKTAIIMLLTSFVPRRRPGSSVSAWSQPTPCQPRAERPLCGCVPGRLVGSPSQDAVFESVVPYQGHRWVPPRQPAGPSDILTQTTQQRTWTTIDRHQAPRSGSSGALGAAQQRFQSERPAQMFRRVPITCRTSIPSPPSLSLYLWSSTKIVPLSVSPEEQRSS